MANKTSGKPYQVGSSYLLKSVVSDNATHFGGEHNYLTVITEPVNGVAYRVTFRHNGEIPYNGKAVECVLITEV